MAKSQSAWRSPWFLGLILLGIVFVGANVYLIWLAGTSAPDLVADNYYERGQDYEKNMLKRMARDPGWEMELLPPKSVKMSEPAEFTLTLRGKDGSIVNPDAVILYAYRPSDADADFVLSMTSVSAGQYKVDASFPLKGIWDLIASVKHGEDEYNLSYRLYVDP